MRCAHLGKDDIVISEFPLFIFTTFAGLSIGMYFAYAVSLLSDGDGVGRPALVPVLCLVLLGIGLVGCLGHLAHPERFLHALANPRAGIAQEAYCSIAFGALVAVDAVLALAKKSRPKALAAAGALFGLVLAFIMGFAYMANIGTPAWSHWAAVPLYLLGDVAMGAALYALVDEGFAKARGLVAGTLAVTVLFAASLVVEGMHFAAVGHSAAAFYVSAALCLAVCATLWGSSRTKALAYATFALLLAAVCVARWTFYAASIV